MMLRIDVDEVAQAACVAEVRRFHTQACLQVEDLAGQRHTLVTISPEGVLCDPFDGQASQYCLTGSGGRTRWPCSAGPSNRLHVRADGRGQLEVWSGSLPVAKHFDSEATPAEWCAGLIHAEASKVRNLEALLGSDSAQSLKSLDLGGAESLDDLSLVGRLMSLRSLYLNNCPELVDLTPLSKLSELLTLDLGGCFKVCDLAPLVHLADLQSLDLHECGVSDISPLVSLRMVRELNLEGCQVADVGPLRGLGGLKVLNLFGTDVSDLSPLDGIKELTDLGLRFDDSTLENGLEWVAGLAHLTSLKLGFDGQTSIDLAPLSALERVQELSLLHFRDRVRDLRSLEALKELRSLTLEAYWIPPDQASGHGLEDLGPLAGLPKLESLSIRNCPDLEDISPLAGLDQLAGLSLDGCSMVIDLSALAGLTLLESLGLEDCKAMTNLEPLEGLSHLRRLHLKGCRQLERLKPLAGLTKLSYLNLESCRALSDIHPLASLEQLVELNLSATNVKDLRPLANLKGLRSLDLSMCDRISHVRPLSGLTNLASLEMHSCERLALVAPLAELPLLKTLNLDFCANIRDADALSGAQSLSKLNFEESATRDSVLLACAVRRGGSDLVAQAATAAASFELSKSPSEHARGLVTAVEVLILQPSLSAQVLHDIAAAFKTRGAVPSKTWQALFSAIARAPDPTLRPAFEVALSDLPLSDSERVLAPALLALADVPAPTKAWALDLVQRTLSAVAASAAHAREVAPAAAVFFHAQGLAGEVEAWLERGSVAQVPTWRDRVLVALLGRALRSGEILEARRLLALLQTPERRDEARGLLVQHLISRAEFRDAAAELDAIVGRAVRASVAANALRQAPDWAGEADAGLSLLLALDGDPKTLAEVLSSMIQQAPDSELVRHLAAVFAPTQGVDLAESVDALLAHPSVTDRVKPKQLAALRGRISADAALAHQALVHGTAALLEAEGLVDDGERAEITVAILGQPA